MHAIRMADAQQITDRKEAEIEAKRTARREYLLDAEARCAREVEALAATRKARKPNRGTLEKAWKGGQQI